MDDVDGVIGGDEPGIPSTWRFSYDVATRWEEAFREAGTPRTRKIALRSAIVMSPDRGGAFDTLLNLVRLGLGGSTGSGNQFVSWIHDADFARAVEFLIGRGDLEGAINIAAPNPLSNRDFMAAMRRAYGAPIGLPPRTGCSRWGLSSCAPKASWSSRAAGWFPDGFPTRV